MRFPQLQLVVASTLGFATLFLSAPSQAAITGCAGGTSGQFLWGDIKNNPGFTCTIEDKVYSGFSYSSILNKFSPGYTSGIDDSDVFSLSATGAGLLVHNINIQALNEFNNAQVDLAYTVTRASGSNDFERYSGNITGDNSNNWGLSIAATNAAGSPSTTPGFPTLGQSATTPNVNFNPGTFSSTFSNTLLTNQSQTGVTQFSNRLVQQVPGPLPILGAGAAFGFSRKIRRRIKASA